MSLPTLLNALEGLVFEIALWVLLIPKTLFHVIRRPAAIPALAPAPSGDTEGALNDEYVSLVLLWLIVGVLPGIPMITSEQGPQWIAHSLLGRLSVDASIVAGATLLLLAPLSFATGQCLVTGSRIARSTLRRPFTLQCGCFAPFCLAYFVAVGANHQATITVYEQVYGGVRDLVLSSGLIWFFVAEYVVLRLECGGRAVRALAAMALGLLLWLGFVVVSRLILLLVGVYYL
jgi:hypothetical protein